MVNLPEYVEMSQRAIFATDYAYCACEELQAQDVEVEAGSGGHRLEQVLRSMNAVPGWPVKVKVTCQPYGRPIVLERRLPVKDDREFVLRFEYRPRERDSHFRAIDDREVVICLEKFHATIDRGLEDVIIVARETHVRATARANAFSDFLKRWRVRWEAANSE